MKFPVFKVKCHQLDRRGITLLISTYKYTQKSCFCLYALLFRSLKRQWRCKSKSKKLRKGIDDEVLNATRWIHVPSTSEHAMHPVSDVRSILYYLCFYLSMNFT